MIFIYSFDGSVQDCSNSSALEFWSYCSLSPNHRLVVIGINSFIFICRLWYHNATMHTFGLLLTKIYHFKFTQPDPACFLFGKSDISFFMYPVSVPYPMLATTHYCNFIMGAIASQITSLTNIDSNVYSGADQRKHQSSVSRTGLCAGNSPATGEFHTQMASNAYFFPFHDVIVSCGVHNKKIMDLVETKMCPLAHRTVGHWIKLLDKWFESQF